MNKFKHQKYSWENRTYSIVHRWAMMGPEGGIDFHVSHSNDRDPICGLEIHHSARAKCCSVSNSAPDYLTCELLREACWHTGSSLYATNILWPLVEPYLKTGDHEKVFNILEDEYNDHYG